MNIRWFSPAAIKEIYTTHCGCLATLTSLPGCLLNDFSDFIVDDGINQAHSLCSFHAMFLQSSPNVAPQRMCRDLNAFTKRGQVTLTEAYITPLIKKPTLYSNDIYNCRPISNLSVLLKLWEKAACKQLVSYLDVNNPMPRNRSVHRRNHSTETSWTKVFSDIVSANGNGNFVLLSLLELSAALDCVDHEILLNFLGRYFGKQSKVSNWRTWDLTGRTQGASIRKSCVRRNCNFAGLPNGTIGRLQSVFHVAARIITGVLKELSPLKCLHLRRCINCQYYGNDMKTYWTLLSFLGQTILKYLLHQSCQLDSLHEACVLFWYLINFENENAISRINNAIIE